MFEILEQEIINKTDAKKEYNKAMISNPYKYNKIKNILKEGFDLKENEYIIKVENNLIQHTAFIIEAWLIWAIGRGHLGPLTNLTDGGEGGITGWNHSEETKLKLKLWNIKYNKWRGKKHTPQTILIIKKFSTGRKHTDEYKKVMSDKLRGGPGLMLGKIHNNETKRKIGNKHIGLKHTSESKKIISEKLKGKTAWNKGIPRTDEEKKKMSESGKVKIFTKEHRKNLSMALINRWKKKNLKFIKKES